MPKKKSPTGNEANIKVGDVSGVNGNVNIAGGDITTHQTASELNAVEMKQLFKQLYAAIEANSKAAGADKEDLKAEVEEIQAIVTEALQKNEKVEESFLSRRFRNIARVAPDMLDVVVATLGNPLAGVGIAVKKIAEKAKAEVTTDNGA
jgi:hypothetical protein